MDSRFWRVPRQAAAALRHATVRASAGRQCHADHGVFPRAPQTQSNIGGSTDGSFATCPDNQDSTNTAAPPRTSAAKEATMQPRANDAEWVAEPAPLPDRVAELENRERLLLDSIEEGFYEVDLNGVFTAANEALARIVGTERRQLVGTSFNTAVSDESESYLRKTFESIYNSGEPLKGVEWDFTRLNDGALRRVRASVGVVRDPESGHVVAFQGLVRDVTEEADQESVYRALVEQANDAIVIIQGSELVYRNKATDEMLGGMPDNVDWTDFVHPSARSTVIENYEGRVAGGDAPDRYEMVLLSSMGHEVVCEASPRRIQYKGQPAVMAILRDITAQREAESEAADATRRFQVVVEQTSDAIVIVQDGYVQYLNPAAEKLLELQADTRTHWLDLIAPEQREQVIARDRDRVEGRPAPSRYDLTIVTGSGRRIVAEVAPQNIEHRGVPATLAVLRDMTEVRAREAELRERDAMLRRSQEIGRIGSWTHDVRSDDFMVSAEFARIFEHEDAPLRGKQADFRWIWSHFSPETLADVRPIMREALERHEPWSYEYQIELPSGASRTILGRGSGEHDDEGELLRVTGYVQDVTDQRAAEREILQAAEALQESEARYREIVDNATDMICTMGFDEITTSVNPRVKDILGYEPIDLIGQDHSRCISPQSEAKYRWAIANLVSGEMTTARVELDLVGAHGDFVPTECHFRVVEREAREPIILGNVRDLSDRVRAEESELRAAEIIENAYDIIYTADLAGQITSVNRRAEEVFGLPRDAIVGANLASIIQPGEPSDFDDVLSRLIAEPEQFDRVIFPVPAANGETLTIETTPRVVFRDGAPIEVLGMARDITKRMAAEQALRESEARLRQAQELARVATWTWDVAEDRVEWGTPNEGRLGLQNLLGTSMSEFYEFIAEGQRQGVIDGIDSALRSGGTYQSEFDVHLPAGVSLRVKVWAAVERDEAGRAVKMAGAIQDVSDLREAERALRANEALLEHAQSLARVAPWSWDPIEDKVTWSEGAHRAFGLGGELPEDMSLQSVVSLVHEDDAPRVMAALESAVASGSVFEDEFRMRDVSGGDAYLRTWADIELGEDGNAVRAVGAVQDITELRLAEKALRTSEAQLRQAQKMEAIGTLAGGVAHDFNNLLTVINGYSEMLEASFEPGEPKREFASEIRAAGDRAGELTRQLLAFSRQQVVARQPLDLNGVVEGMVRMLERLIGAHVNLTMDLGEGLPQVNADKGQLEQILLNLAVNARDAMPDGGDLVVSTSQEKARDGRKLCHAVSARHRDWHVRRREGPPLRAVLHNEGSWERHRPRPCDRLRNCDPIRRDHRG